MFSIIPVKIAISVGEFYFCLVGKKDLYVHYVLVGQPMWNVKAGEKLTQPGEIVITVKAMTYVNLSLYECTELDNKRYFKICGYKDSIGSIHRQHGNKYSSFKELHFKYIFNEIQRL